MKKVIFISHLIAVYRAFEARPSQSLIFFPYNFPLISVDYFLDVLLRWSPHAMFLFRRVASALRCIDCTTTIIIIFVS